MLGYLNNSIEVPGISYLSAELWDTMLMSYAYYDIFLWNISK